MSSPAPTTPKAPRNGRRYQKRTPSSKSGAADPSRQPDKTNTTPAANRDSNVASDSGNRASDSAVKAKNGRSAKKNRDNHKNSPAPARTASLGHGHRHTSSQSSIKDSPLYAGPTFHASPAPSALPIPSFFSKSVPETDSRTSDELQDESPDTDPGDSTPTKANNAPQQTQQEAGTASPLDFLFKAARQARAANPVSELEDSGPFNGSTPPRNEARPQQGERQISGGVFPLELEGSDTRMSPIGPSFATSFKDRMNALRATSPGKQGGFPGTTRENNTTNTNKLKSEALKNLLLNPPLQRAASASPRLTDPSNGPNNNGSSNNKNDFRMSGDYSMYQQPTRYASGPASPVPFAHSGKPLGTRNEFSGPESTIPQQYLASLCAQTHRPPAPSSGLRSMVSPTNNPITPPRQQPFSRYAQFGLSSAPPAHASYNGPAGGALTSPTPNRTMQSNSTTPPARNAPPAKLDSAETKRMEDDLRRMLNLNVGDGQYPENTGRHTS
ncbi:hypothetical protein GTR04_7120 [Trichophyton interdigitale]|uniref:Proteophosphoglycan 5 n=1 Tax=Trichophyton interdigitale (strain MR816) TaxID=1215338 RepID=A0A059JC09_TRIIM|nr:hypothetical protein H101_03401 [Trichophyton interdigitale H6]KAG5204548.1 hypothetical protein GY631_7098 [Trichophyton interdigitale]KAG5217007.1 hypothetical protein GY632_6987 [Trichophyton interdigitale]KAG8205501.1 hypothetical protein GTR04_7120 [Trichophyton interdigitale]KDB25017.1 hypothetical protein H109_03141 [Trichophyton interdigitale MR816]